MNRNPASPFARDDQFRQRAARRRFGTNVSMVALAAMAALLVAAMIYIVVTVVTLLANMLGQQATGRIEQQSRAGVEVAVAIAATALPRG
ncbi:hypothetical protein [Sandarakinorhabdus sp. DWP1-3-1]|uniref:hypothetical protein n=1 Tax=Sandarakinorhabdus sp. DWP1-3-1 TaxID=2804627 RepID=UPI003CE7E194